MIQYRPVAKLWAMAAASSLFDRSPLIRAIYNITSNSQDYHIHMSILPTFKFELWQRLAWRSCLNHFAILCFSVLLVWKKYSSDCLHVCDANLDTCREGNLILGVAPIKVVCEQINKACSWLIMIQEYTTHHGGIIPKTVSLGCLEASHKQCSWFSFCFNCLCIPVLRFCPGFHDGL